VSKLSQKQIFGGKLKEEKKNQAFTTLKKKAELLVRIYLFVVVVFLFNLPFFL